MPQFGTISMKDDGGKRRVFAHKISVTGAKRPDLPRGDNKYVKDAKAAHIVRVWPSGITWRRSPTEGLTGHHQMPGRSWRAGKAIAAMESP